MTPEEQNKKLRAAVAPFAGLPLWRDSYPDSPVEVSDGWMRLIPAAWIVNAREAAAAIPADSSHRASYLIELHVLVGELITRPPGNEWVAVDRETFDKLRRLHAGDAP